MRVRGGAGHLTYCTNVHPGESWDDVRGHLERDVPAVQERVCPDQPFGVGLRLAGQAHVSTGRAGCLCQTRNLALKLFAADDHQVGRLVDNHNDVREQREWGS